MKFVHISSTSFWKLIKYNTGAAGKGLEVIFPLTDQGDILEQGWSWVLFVSESYVQPEHESKSAYSVPTFATVENFDEESIWTFVQHVLTVIEFKLEVKNIVDNEIKSQQMFVAKITRELMMQL